MQTTCAFCEFASSVVLLEGEFHLLFLRFFCPFSVCCFYSQVVLLCFVI